MRNKCNSKQQLEDSGSSLAYSLEYEAALLYQEVGGEEAGSREEGLR